MYQSTSTSISPPRWISRCPQIIIINNGILFKKGKFLIVYKNFGKLFLGIDFHIFLRNRPRKNNENIFLASSRDFHEIGKT